MDEGAGSSLNDSLLLLHSLLYSSTTEGTDVPFGFSSVDSVERTSQTRIVSNLCDPGEGVQRGRTNGEEHVISSRRRIRVLNGSRYLDLF